MAPRKTAVDETKDRQHPFQEGMQFQRLSWRLRTIAWSVMAAFIFAAVLGVFSVGPLSNIQLTSGDGSVTLDTQRFLRNGATEQITIRYRAEQPGDYEVVLAPAVADAFEITEVQPAPTESRRDAAGLHFRFSGSANENIASLSIRPEHIGPVNGEIVVGGSPINWRSFIYP